MKILCLLISALFMTGNACLPQKSEILVSNTREEPKVASYTYQEVFNGHPVAFLIAKEEASDGKGGIDLNAYNPKDTDGKEKFGPMQFDEDTFYSGAKRFELKDADIKNPFHQVWMFEKYVAAGEYWRWPTWTKKVFSR